MALTGAILLDQSCTVSPAFLTCSQRCDIRDVDARSPGLYLSFCSQQSRCAENNVVRTSIESREVSECPNVQMLRYVKIFTSSRDSAVKKKESKIGTFQSSLAGGTECGCAVDQMNQCRV